MEAELVSCDKCQEHFELKQNIKERKYPGLITEHYIQCPHCLEEFISYVTDPHVLKEQEEIRKLHEKYIKRKGKLSGHMEKLKQDILSKKEASV